MGLTQKEKIAELRNLLDLNRLELKREIAHREKVEYAVKQKKSCLVYLGVGIIIATLFFDPVAGKFLLQHSAGIGFFQWVSISIGGLMVFLGAW